MKDAQAQPEKIDIGERPTELDAEACLHYLAQISSGISALLSSDDTAKTTVNRQDAAEERRESPGRMSDGMYRRLLEQLPVVTFMAQLGADLSDFYVSPQIEALLGFTQQEWLENPVLWYERLHPEDKTRWNMEFARFLTLNEPFRSVYRFIARDGRVVWIRGEVEIVWDAPNQRAYVQGIGYDISELKQAEVALKQAHDQLEQRVEERTAQLVGANAALQAEIADRQRAETRLLRQAKDLRQQQQEIEALNQRLRRAMVETHHHIKNNLQIISALIELQLVDDMTVVPAEELRRIGTQIRTLAVVHDLLTRYAKQDAEADGVSAREVLEKLIAMLKQMNGNGHLHAQIENVDLSPKQVSAVAIVINELVANAAKCGADVIGISFIVQKDRAILEVADNGPGFPKHFDPRSTSGYGLELVEQVTRFDLQAEVAYDNQPQGGARVIIDIPLLTASQRRSLNGT